MLLTLVAIGVAMVLSSPGLLAAPGAAQLQAPPLPPPPPPPAPPQPTSAPPPSDGTPVPSSGGGGGGGGSSYGGSRFLKCNSTIKGFVTNYADRSPGSGAIVQIGRSGWKSEMPADSNGHYEFGGLCEGMAFVKVLVPEGGLPTNPDAEAVLDGKNLVSVDLGFFPPPPADQLAATQLTAAPLLAAPAVRIVAPGATPAPPVIEAVAAGSGPSDVPLSPGISVQLNAPRVVRSGLAARMTASIRNGGPNQATGTIVTIPIPPGVVLQEVTTSRGQLKMTTTGAAMLGNASGAKGSALVVEAGNLAVGQSVVIAGLVRFDDNAAVGSKVRLACGRGRWRLQQAIERHLSGLRRNRSIIPGHSPRHGERRLRGLPPRPPVVIR